MNNLFSAITASVGFNSVIKTQPRDLPYTIDDVKIRLNDIVSTDNFNFSLSCLYDNFLNVASRSYIYNPRFPVTNPFLGSTNNTVCTLCGTFCPSPDSENFEKYYVNGIQHSLSAFHVIYDKHDLYINDDYITLAVGVLSAESITTENNFGNNKYKSSLLILNYSLSSIYNTTNLPYSAGFGSQGIDGNLTPNFSLHYQDIINNNLKFNKIEKLKFFNNKLYVLDSFSRSFLEYDVSDVLINRNIDSSYNIPKTKLGFQINKKTNNESREITTFCVNKNYFVFYNYVKDALSIFSSSFKKLYDYFEPNVTLDGGNKREQFADIEFSNDGKLYLLTKEGSIYSYILTQNSITLVNKANVKTNTVFYTSVSSTNVLNFTEYFKKIEFSRTDDNIFYLSTNTNVFKKFISTLDTVGQFNTNILNTSYYSTLSGSLDPLNTLFTPPTGYNYRKYDFLKYSINSVKSFKLNDYDIISLSFTDNSTFSNTSTSTVVENVSGDSKTFWELQLSTGLNPVSASGISIIVDRPNYINLNNDDINNIKIYDLDDINVKSEEFVSDFSINKSLRKLLYSIYNFQTYLTFKPVIEIDVNNNPLYKRLDYIVPFSKDQDFSNFDNFVGINEINSTLFLNRCFTKIYNLILSIKNNVDPDVRDIFPRFVDSVQITNNSENHIILFEDSKQWITGEYKQDKYPLNRNLCAPLPTPTPTSSPVPTSTSCNVSPTPTPTASGGSSPTPTPTPSVTPTNVPDPTANVRKSITHIVDVSLTNEESTPTPVAPFTTNTNTISAIYPYDDSGYQTMITPITATFNHTQFNLDLALSNGDFYSLIGRKYGDYTLSLYTSAYNSDFKKKGRE